MSENTTAQSILTRFPDLAATHPEAWAFLSQLPTKRRPGPPGQWQDREQFLSFMGQVKRRIERRDLIFTERATVNYVNREIERLRPLPAFDGLDLEYLHETTFRRWVFRWCGSWKALCDAIEQEPV